MKKRLWIVSEFFYPDETATAYILTNIANALSDNYEINVICGPKSSSIATVSHIKDTIKIHRVKLFNLSKDKLFTRSIRLLLITISFAGILLFKSRRRDKVLVVTNPAPFLVTASVIKKIRRFELTILTHDLFPENVIPAGVLRSQQSLLYKLLLWIFNHSYTSADKIIAIGRDMEEMIRQKISKYNSKAVVKVITNWADPWINVNSARPCLDKIDIQYAGNIGRVQGLMDFLEIFKQAENNAVLLSIWGGGAMYSTIKNMVQEWKLDNIFQHGFYTRNQYERITQNSDLCLVTLVDGMYGLGVPSKAYNIMAAGKPILFIGPQHSEIWRLVTENGIGYCFTPTDKEGIIQFVKSLSLQDRDRLAEMGRKARELAMTTYARDKILLEYCNFV